MIPSFAIILKVMFHVFLTSNAVAPPLLSILAPSLLKSSFLPRSNNTVRIRPIYGLQSGRSNTHRITIKIKQYKAVYCENTAPYTGPFLSKVIRGRIFTV
jgi:hypothetical protein